MFSKKYKNFSDWKKNFKGSKSYKERIIREHKNYPQASLTQLRGHPKKREKSISKLKHIKKSRVRLVVVQGNAINKDENETGKNVYFEAYVRIADKNVDKFIVKIFKRLDEEGIKIFRSDPMKDRININVGNRYGSKKISQKKYIEKAVEAVKKEMHPAVPRIGTHHKRKRENHEKYKEEYENE